MAANSCPVERRCEGEDHCRLFELDGRQRPENDRCAHLCSASGKRSAAGEGGDQASSIKNSQAANTFFEEDSIESSFSLTLARPQSMRDQLLSVQYKNES